ncbi:ester cyclase [Caulobacter sp. KR2-114]|uniref:ester cyclase n=1 Tax=Caulobacter sp. KR2-114 TaxID=3400912 RepID=UPI003C10BB85
MAKPVCCDPPNEEFEMSIEANKALVRTFYEAIDRADFAALDDLCHKDFVFYSQVDTPKPGVMGFVNSEKAAFDAFESVRFPLEQMVAEGDKVGAYLLFLGKNQIRNLGDLKPRGKDLRISLFCLLTIKDGKIIEKRAHFDNADARAQLTAP